nr:RHS repeat-associated core domain-containing protein [Kiritimatiellia bacterium]
VFYCHDANKNVTDLVDTIGDVVAHYEYSPFGVITDQSEELASLNPFRFSNEYFDEITGIVEYMLRPYIPPLAKFMTRDPIGVQGGLNEYGICANDLVNYWDEWGLSENDNGMSIYVGFGPDGGKDDLFYKIFKDVILKLGRPVQDSEKNCKTKCKLVVKWSLLKNQLIDALKSDYQHVFLFAHGQINKLYRRDKNGRNLIKEPQIPYSAVRFADGLNSPKNEIASIVKKIEADVIKLNNAEIDDEYKRKKLPELFVLAQTKLHPYVCYPKKVLPEDMPANLDEGLGIKVEHIMTSQGPIRTTLAGKSMADSILTMFKESGCQKIEITGYGPTGTTKEVRDIGGSND